MERSINGVERGIRGEWSKAEYKRTNNGVLRIDVERTWGVGGVKRSRTELVCGVVYNRTHNGVKRGAVGGV